MPFDGFTRFSLTDGERSVLLAYIGVGLFGAGLSFNVVNTLGGGQEIIRSLGLLDLWMILAGALGAMGALFSTWDRFGHPGWKGAKRATWGFPLLSIAAAVMAGTLALPGYGTMFGPFAAGLAFVQVPLLLIFWMAIVLASHLLIAIWRRERDTLFTVPDDGIPT